MEQPQNIDVLPQANTPVPPTTTLEPNNSYEPVDKITKRLALDQLVDTQHWTKAFKIHAAIATFFSGISFGIWFFIALFVYEYPWFIFVNTFFAFTLSLHFFAVIRRDSLQFHLSMFAVINLMLFLIWTFGTGPYPWFIVCLFSMAIPLAIHYAAKTFHNSPEKSLYVHSSFWASVNALCFVTWLMDGSYPWFMHVLFASAFFVIAHYCGHYFKESKRWFLIHLGFFVNLQIYLFYIWASSGMGFPWFIFAFVPLAVILFIHYRIYKSKQTTALPTQTYTVTPYSTGMYQNAPVTVTTTSGAPMMLYPPQQPIYVPASSLSSAQPIFVASSVAPPPPYASAMLYGNVPTLNTNNNV